MVILSRQLLSRECNKRRGPRVKRPSCANTSPLHRCFFDLKCFKFSLSPLHFRSEMFKILSLGKGKPRSWSQVGKVSQVEWIPLKQPLIEPKRLSPQQSLLFLYFLCFVLLYLLCSCTFVFQISKWIPL